MQTNTYKKTMLYLGAAGVLFSGYLSATKFFTATCAFNEPCPYFLGYPACYFGFGMFLVIFLSALFGLFKTISEKMMSKVIVVVSGLGILFAGYFTIPEIGKLVSGAQTGYSLGLPTCSYGLIFFIIIFCLSLWYLKSSQNEQNLENR